MLLCLLQSSTMCIITTARGSPENNKVCKYWLQGRCTRNLCQFSHVSPLRKSPPSQKLEQIKEMAWRRNPISHGPKNLKKVVVSAKELTDQMLSEKAMFHDQHEPKKSSSLQKSQPKGCNNRVSENCKDMHTRFYGTGLTIVTKLEGHSKAITGLVLPTDSDKLHSASNDTCIGVWDCNTGQCVLFQSLGGEVGCLITEGPWMFAGLPNTVKDVITLNGFHIKEANQPVLICSCDDNTVRLYDLPSFTERGRIFSTREVQVIQTHVHEYGLFFIGDVAGEVSVRRLVGEPEVTST